LSIKLPDWNILQLFSHPSERLGSFGCLAVENDTIFYNVRLNEHGFVRYPPQIVDRQNRIPKMVENSAKQYGVEHSQIIRVELARISLAKA
jgi:hypothetical protein